MRKTKTRLGLEVRQGGQEEQGYSEPSLGLWGSGPAMGLGSPLATCSGLAEATALHQAGVLSEGIAFVSQYKGDTGQRRSWGNRVPQKKASL